MTEWDAARSIDPTVTLTGSFKNSELNVWIAFGQVALKNKKKEIEGKGKRNNGKKKKKLPKH